MAGRAAMWRQARFHASHPGWLLEGVSNDDPRRMAVAEGASSPDRTRLTGRLVVFYEGSMPKPELHAVVEAQWWLQDPSKFHWLASIESTDWVRLGADMSNNEIAAVLAILLAYNRIEVSSLGEAVERLAEADELVLPGGVRVSLPGAESICPSCCCGLEDWRDWLTVLETGGPLWLGHDPSPWLEIDGQKVCVWSDESPRNKYSIEFSKQDFQSALEQLQLDVQRFKDRLGGWAEANSIEQHQALLDKFDYCFSVSRDFRG